MSRTEQFGIGVAIMAVGLTLLRTAVGWAALFAGVAVLADIYVRDYLFGTYRPTKQEIDRMPAPEYREKIRDKKFRRYVNRLFKNSGRYKLIK